MTTHTYPHVTDLSLEIPHQNGATPVEFCGEGGIVLATLSRDGMFRIHCDPNDNTTRQFLRLLRSEYGIQLVEVQVFK